MLVAIIGIITIIQKTKGNSVNFLTTRGVGAALEERVFPTSLVTPVKSELDSNVRFHIHHYIIIVTYMTSNQYWVLED